jgi:hypothetical protein
MQPAAPREQYQDFAAAMLTNLCTNIHALEQRAFALA